MINLYEVDEDSGNPDPNEDTYTEPCLMSCGHVQVWEQFKGLPMNHDPREVCWDCQVCDTCGLKRSECRCDPFDDEPFPTVEEERARMGEGEAAADRAWEART